MDVMALDVGTQVPLAGVFGWLGGFGVFLAGVFALVTVVVHVVFALGVMRDMARLLEEGRTPLFAPPWAWAFTTFVGGLVGVAVYYALHRAPWAAARGVSPPTS
jgi:hypothetical protein